MSDQRRSFTVGPTTTTVTFTSRPGAVAGSTDGAVLSVFDDVTRPLFPFLCAHTVVLPPGERSKNWGSVETILSVAVDAGLGRDACFLAVGGGVVCDVAAFAASVYIRGCGLVLAPTTLLSMVDASVGGKTGIDFRELKNMVGTFHAAREVRICVDVLGSLPAREYLSGLAEVIKHALLGDEDLFRLLEGCRERVLDRESDIMSEVIGRSIDKKGEYVTADPREGGVRAHLNFGHTFAHALESVTGFARFTHGEAVAWGIGAALEAGVLAGRTDPRYRETVVSLLEEYGFRMRAVSVEPRLLLDAMKHDKKKREGRVRYVLQSDFGRTELVELDDDIVLRALERTT